MSGLRTRKTQITCPLDDDDGPDDPSDYGGFSRYRRGRRCKYILSFCFFFQNWKVIMLGTALSMTVIGYWYDYQFNRGIPDRVFIIPTMLKNIIMGFGRGITEYVYKPAGDAAIRKGALVLPLRGGGSCGGGRRSGRR